ncbi:MAG: SpoIIE family protein phosphatase [Elusimicrobiota bacterium]
MSKKKMVSLQVKFSLVISALICLIMAAVGMLITNRMKQPMENEIIDKGKTLAMMLASNTKEEILVNDEIDEMLLVGYIDRVRDMQSILYAMVLNGQGEVLAHSDLKIRRGGTFKDALTLKTLNYQGHAPLVTPSSTPQLGEFYDISLPIFAAAKKLGTVRLGFSGEGIKKAVSQMRRMIISITIGVVVLGLIVSWMLVSFITKPLKSLYKGVEIVGNGDLNHKITIKSRDEIGQLANSFNSMTERLQVAQKELIEKERLGQELQIAQQIQQSLLPKECPQLADFNLQAYYRAAKEIGGDYYDFMRITPERLGIVVADVSGKGVPGSLGMAITRTIFRSQIDEKRTAAEILARTNELVYKELKRGIFVTMFLAILDTKYKILNCACAGHNPPLSLQGGHPVWLNTESLALGVEKGALFNRMVRDEMVPLYSGDIFCFYTDGVTEAMNNENEEFGEKRLELALLEYKEKKPNDIKKETVIEVVNGKINNFVKNHPQHDDITFVSLEVN